MFRQRAKGLFDFAAALLAIGTLVRATPVGEIAVRGARWVAGAGTPARPLASYFENAGDFAAAGAGGRRLPEPLRRALERARPSAEVGALVKGLAVALIPPGGSTVDFALPAAALGMLRKRGASDADLATPTGRMAASARVLQALEARFGGTEPALVALFTGEDVAAYALTRARAVGGPPTADAMLPNLPSGLRDELERTVVPALALATAFDLAWPASARHSIASPFGMRVHPVLGVLKMHTGVDISMPPMTRVNATSEGTVARIGDDVVNGRFVVVEHGRGVTTAYCHNTRILVRHGEAVARGQLIAYSGATGRATGPHLHYQLEIGGEAVDPVPFRPAADDRTGRGGSP